MYKYNGEKDSNGKYHGRGNLYLRVLLKTKKRNKSKNNENGSNEHYIIEYSGFFINGKKNGFGTIYDTRCNDKKNERIVGQGKKLFYGMWKNDKKDGIGCEFLTDKRLGEKEFHRKGIWKNDKYIHPLNLCMDGITSKNFNEFLKLKNVKRISTRKKKELIVLKDDFSTIWKGDSKCFQYYDYRDGHSLDLSTKLERVLRQNLIFNNQRNILPILGVQEYENSVVFLTEECSYSLFEYMRKEKGKVTFSEKLNILYQISLGMEFVYNLGYSHGDLVLENILLDKNRNVKIANFFNMKDVFIKSRWRFSVFNNSGTLQQLPICEIVSKDDFLGFARIIFQILFYGDEFFGNWTGNISSYYDEKQRLRPSVPKIEEEKKWLIDLMKSCWDYQIESFTEIINLMQENMVGKNDETTEEKVQKKIQIEFKEGDGTFDEFSERCINNDVKYVRRYFKKGDIDVYKHLKVSIFHGRKNIIEILLTHEKVDFGKGKDNLIYICCCLGFIDILKTLLEHPKASVSDDDFENTPLCVALCNNNIKALSLLLEFKDANIEQTFEHLLCDTQFNDDSLFNFFNHPNVRNVLKSWEYRKELINTLKKNKSVMILILLYENSLEFEEFNHIDFPQGVRKIVLEFFKNESKFRIKYAFLQKGIINYLDDVSSVIEKLEVANEFKKKIKDLKAFKKSIENTEKFLHPINNFLPRENAMKLKSEIEIVINGNLIDCEIKKCNKRIQVLDGKKKKYKYVGKWKNNMFDGKNCMLFESFGLLRKFKLVYQGDFKMGRKNGNGVLYDKKGVVRFRGQFKNGKRHGIGMEYDEDGIWIRNAVWDEDHEEYVKLRVKVKVEEMDEKMREELMETVFNTTYQYRLNHLLLGCGGFAKVYKFVTKDGTQYAFKYFENFDLTSENDKKLLQRDIEIPTMYTHPNIIRIFRVNWKPPVGFLIELCSRTVYDVIGKCFRLKENDIKKNKIPKDFYLTDEEKLWIVHQTSLGMVHLHKNNVLHRDLKWKNVMIKDYPFKEVKIIDFGLSKALKRFRMSSHYSSAGTHGFISPEQLIDGKCDLSSDVFSFGMMLFMLIFETPWCFNRELHGSELSLKIKQNQRPTIPQNYKLSSELKKLIRIMILCWDRVPSERPTFLDIVELIENPEFLCNEVDDTFLNMNFSNNFIKSMKCSVNKNSLKQGNGKELISKLKSDFLDDYVISKAFGEYVFTGTIKDDSFDGFGTLFKKIGNSLQVQYCGGFSNGKRNGIGKEFEEGKLSFYGNFKNDSRRGIGIRYQNQNQKQGEIVYGVFKGEKVIKKFTLEDNVKNMKEELVNEVNKILDSKFDVRMKHKVGNGSLGTIWGYKSECLKKKVAFKHFTKFNEFSLSKGDVEVIKKGFTSTSEMLMELCESDVIRIIHDAIHEREVKMKEYPVIALEKKLLIIYQTAIAMENLHKNGIIHRDLKWGNVLLTNSHTKIKIIDFESGKLKIVKSSLRKTYGTGGTPCYCAPEKKVSEKTDVFSFGIMLYELFFEKLDVFELRCNDVFEEEKIKQLIVSGKRPEIPDIKIDKKISWIIDLMILAWFDCSDDRPTFSEIVKKIENPFEYIIKTNNLNSSKKLTVSAASKKKSDNNENEQKGDIGNNINNNCKIQLKMFVKYESKKKAFTCCSFNDLKEKVKKRFNLNRDDFMFIDDNDCDIENGDDYQEICNLATLRVKFL